MGKGSQQLTLQKLFAPYMISVFHTTAAFNIMPSRDRHVLLHFVITVMNQLLARGAKHVCPAVSFYFQLVLTK
jgi:hypothetical protein